MARTPRRWRGSVRRGARSGTNGSGPSGEARLNRIQVRKSVDGPLYAALDLGTNNCRLLIATPQAGGFRVLDAFSRIVRLGEGASRSGALRESAMRRTISALRVCANKITWWNARQTRLIATEACRVAENGAEFIARVAAETGLELEIIDRESEARLAAAGAAPLLDQGAENVVVFDIGGGSTELMWLSITAGSQEIVEWTSIPAGVVTMAELYGGVEVDEEVFAAMRGHIRPALDGFVARLAAKGIDIAGADHLLGTSGTVTTICGVHLRLKRYDRSRVDGCWLTSQDIATVTGQLRAMTFAERSASPCIGRERADLVLAGCAILEEIRNLWPHCAVRVADRGLREGILTDLMMRAGTYGRS